MSFQASYPEPSTSGTIFFPLPSKIRHLLSLLCLSSLGGGLAVDPDGAEGDEASDGGADSADPGPSSRDDEAARPLIVGNVPDADGVLLVNDRQEWALVVYAEVENTMLVGQDERGAKDGGILGNGNG